MHHKIDYIKNFFRDKKILVAFSGGADSTLLAFLAHEYAKESMAVTFDNGTMPSGFIERSKEIANKIGIEHYIITEDLQREESFSSNPSQRCYFCKKIIYQHLTRRAQDENMDLVVDGTNLSDLFEDRPGLRVSQEKKIQMPLLEAGFTSQEIKKLLQELDIDYSPSTTCLATRIVTDNLITPHRISKVEQAEEFVNSMVKDPDVRVRYDQGYAILEVSDLERLLDKRILELINQELKKIDFKRVMLNLEGYQTTKNDQIVFIPGNGEENLMEIKLPYPLHLEETRHHWKEGVEGSSDGPLHLKTSRISVDIFQDGRVKLWGVKNEEEAQKCLSNLMPYFKKKY